jgi:hypothetical protein
MFGRPVTAIQAGAFYRFFRSRLLVYGALGLGQFPSTCKMWISGRDTGDRTHNQQFRVYAAKGQVLIFLRVQANTSV